MSTLKTSRNAVFSSLRSFFDEVYVLTGGGPGSATTYIVHFIFQTAFAQQIRQYGIAAAASLLLAGILFGLTLLQLRAMRGKGK